MIKKTCDFCKKDFEARRNTAKYCSNSCRTKSYMVRNDKGDGSLREGMGLKGVISQTSLKEIEEVKRVSNTVLKELEALKKASNITAKRVATDIATSATGALIAKEVRDFFTKWENQPATKGDLEHLEKLVHHWFRQIRGGLIRDVTSLIKKEQKKGIFY